MDSLAELIAKFDREHPEDMRIAREELKRRPLTSNDFSCVDITEVLLCHEIARLRAELAECKDLLRIASDFVERLPGHEGRTAFTDRIDAALAAKEE